MASRKTRKRSAYASSAVSVLAERVNSWTGRVSGIGSGPGGASSSTANAFVPPIPSELTAARRGPSPAGHVLSSVLTWKGL